ncbi:sensor histidine kinase [Mucilaginibacter sp. NFX135]|uniref:sensor histidine kinase n=1 Tax=Mucilaginibacter sp. NFX135 TaxID=3402687 RepID=UPI003AFB6267
MKFFRRYIFPALYGLLIYFTIRVLNDIVIDIEFWKRSWALNTLEISLSILVGYLGIALFKWLFRYFDKKGTVKLSYKGLVRELFIFVIANLVLINLIFTPMAAFTDDGLSWADAVDINLIPTLYAIIYYGITRTNTWLKAYVNNKMQLEKLTNDHLETELKFLKAQYHPHFLFNALNTIYFQMDEDVAGAKKSTELLSSLLRYQLYDQQQQVSIKQELEYLQDYIQLQKIRASQKMRLKVVFDENLADQQVYPLLLLPLVENAFKYIGGDYRIDISANINEKGMLFKVYNDVPATMKIADNYSGIGHENLKRRLELLYPGKHRLIAGGEAGSYVAQLELEF